jgi:hypothetical protein
MKKIIGFTLGLLLVLPLAVMAQEATAQEETKYTNESVARLSHLSGEVFIQRASDIGFEECVLNTPITEGDRLGTAEGRAEVYFGRANYIRLDNETKIDLLNLPKKGSDVVRFRIWSGSVYLDVANLAREKSIEIHTADASFYVLDEGIYRLDVKENTDSEILVFRGLVEAAGEDGSILIKAGQRLEVAEGRIADRPSQFLVAANDTFDRWNDARNTDVSKRASTKYLPTEMEDFEYELGQYGDWVNLAPYGNVWVPNGMSQDWRPYSNGRWTWLPMTGWTWLPYEPWGWATFHYGRWHWGVGYGWYWIPTSFWGPAWVDWWWDGDYFAWAPLSYYGYPGVLLNGNYYGRHYGDYYPHDSRALMVVRKDQLRARNLSEVALSGDSLKSLNRMSLGSQRLTVRPAGSRTLVEPIEGKKVLLRKVDKPIDLKGGSGAETGASRGIRRESLSPRRGDGASATSGSKGSGETKAAPSQAPKARKIRKSTDGDSYSSSYSGSAGSGSASVQGSTVRSGIRATKRYSTRSYAREGDNPWRNPSIGRSLRRFSGSSGSSYSGSSSSSGSGTSARTGSSSKGSSGSKGSGVRSSGSGSHGGSRSGSGGSSSGVRKK